jgi:hypothetical protein
VGIGQSGTQVMEEMVGQFHKLNPAPAYTLIPFSIESDRDGTSIDVGIDLHGSTFDLDPFLAGMETASTILIVDGVTRTGKTMQRMYSKFKEKGLSRLFCYSVALSSKTTFIPTWYGCMYDPNEQITLIRKGHTPNHAVFQKGKSRTEIASPAIVLRRPVRGDPEIDVKHPISMNRYRSDDRFFDSLTESRNTLVAEWHTTPIGYITYVIEKRVLWVDFIAVDTNHLNNCKGAGPAMYQQIEMLAKMNDCDAIRLWGIEAVKSTYISWGLVPVGNRTIEIGSSPDTEKYHLMEKQLFDETGHYII